MKPLQGVKLQAQPKARTQTSRSFGSTHSTTGRKYLDFLKFTECFYARRSLWSGEIKAGGTETSRTADSSSQLPARRRAAGRRDYCPGELLPALIPGPRAHPQTWSQILLCRVQTVWPRVGRLASQSLHVLICKTCIIIVPMVPASQR